MRYRESMRFWCTILALALSIPAASAARLRKSRLTRAAQAGLRNRLHVNTLITQPGTLEVEWGTTVDKDGNVATPTLVKYTPDGDNAYWGNTEFSVGFDSFDSNVQDGARSNQFSDHVTVTALTGLSSHWTGEYLSLAVGPQITQLLRGDSGERIGVTSVARYSRGLSNGGITMSWSGATRSSDTNPAGIYDLGFGFGRQLGKSGIWDNLTAHANAQLEKATGLRRTVSLFGGVEYQMTPRFSVDLSSQLINVSGGVRSSQLAVGLVLNLGRIW